ncbi:MAG: type II toxin-antitoxin system Phd/YefM family antitoxin, partial [Dehalococcoidia bacterium]
LCFKPGLIDKRLIRLIGGNRDLIRHSACIRFGRSAISILTRVSCRPGKDALAGVREVYDTEGNTGGGVMGRVSVRDLAKNASSVLDEVERTRRPAIITRRGRPVAVLSSVDAADLEDFILANAPEYVRGRQLADEEFARGETRSFL